MKAQLSLEFLIVLLMGIALLSLLVPGVQKMKEVSQHTLLLRNAQFSLDKLYYSCERVKITGESEEITLYLLYNFSINRTSDILSFTFGNTTVSRIFGCMIKQNISVGKNIVLLSPSP